MCGIAGIINFDKSPVDRNFITSITDLIAYRGPDNEGFYFDDENGIGFGHRRLSIIDTSTLGHQPMSNDDETIWITYNGEVYNYLELKDQLKSKGYTFRSNSDTEVILKAYEEWGEDCVKYFNGMWGFAIWDKNKQKLFCSRDRMGVKPFYYFYDSKSFIFASEIKQILLYPDYKFSVYNPALYDYLVYNQINNSTKTLYKDIYQLFGGHSLVIDLSQNKFNFKTYEYWDIDLQKTITGLKDNEYTELFFKEIERSIKYRLRSDVPVGSCLSGGLDSSTIVCLTNKILKNQGNSFIQKTFSSCFEDERFDERNYIELVKQNDSLDCYYTFPDPETLKNEFKKIVWHGDGPIAYGSTFSQRCVFKLAKENNVTVMLDGQGGDEVLAGYHRYFWFYLNQLLRDLKLTAFLNEIYYLNKNHNYGLSILSKVLSISPTPDGLWRKEEPNWLKTDFYESSKPFSTAIKFKHKTFSSDKFKDDLYKLLRYTCLPALLYYEDRNSMSFSVESRVPFLDYKLIELAFALPHNQKIRNGTTKHILRKALKNIVPEKILNRQDKMGFESPDSVWIDYPLKEFFLTILDSETTKKLNIFNISEVKKILNLNYQDRLQYNSILWKIIATIIWYEVNTENYHP